LAMENLGLHIQYCVQGFIQTSFFFHTLFAHCTDHAVFNTLYSVLSTNPPSHLHTIIIMLTASSKSLLLKKMGQGKGMQSNGLRGWYLHNMHIQINCSIFSVQGLIPIQYSCSMCTISSFVPNYSVFVPKLKQA
jgi:hypothetical protein